MHTYPFHKTCIICTVISVSICLFVSIHEQVKTKSLWCLNNHKTSSVQSLIYGSYGVLRSYTYYRRIP